MKRIIYLVCLILISCIFENEDPMTPISLCVLDLNNNEINPITHSINSGTTKFTYDNENILIANDELWIIEVDGSNLTLILSEPTISSNYFNVSPVNDCIIFSDGEDIYKYNYINLTIQNLTDDVYQFAEYPSYSSDGQQIIFSTSFINSDNQSEFTLITMESDGSNKQVIYEDSYQNYSVIHFPIFFNNLDKIAFPRGGLRVMDVDGSELEIIENTEGIQNPITEFNNLVVFEKLNNVYTYNMITEKLRTVVGGIFPQIINNGNKIIYINNYSLRIISNDSTEDELLAYTCSNNICISSDNRYISFWGAY